MCMRHFDIFVKNEKVAFTPALQKKKKTKPKLTIALKLQQSVIFYLKNVLILRKKA